MTEINELKERIAAVLGVNAESITDDFSLREGKFKTSAGTVILSNIVKKIYGKKVNCRNRTTFGELVARIEGEKYIEKIDNKLHDVSRDKSSSYKDVEIQVKGLPVCGIDIQEIDIFPEADDYWREHFYTEDFTKDEVAYCIKTDSPRHSFAGKWCAKEALHKCGPQFYNVPLKDIQVLAGNDGNLVVELRANGNEWRRIPFSCSISHADNYAVGMMVGYARR